MSEKRPYEIPNLTLFPKRKSASISCVDGKEPSGEVDQAIKKKIQSGVIQKVSVLSTGLPSVNMSTCDDQV